MNLTDDQVREIADMLDVCWFRDSDAAIEDLFQGEYNCSNSPRKWELFERLKSVDKLAAQVASETGSGRYVNLVDLADQHMIGNNTAIDVVPDQQDLWLWDKSQKAFICFKFDAVELTMQNSKFNFVTAGEIIDWETMSDVVFNGDYQIVEK